MDFSYKRAQSTQIEIGVSCALDKNQIQLVKMISRSHTYTRFIVIKISLLNLGFVRQKSIKPIFEVNYVLRLAGLRHI